MNILTLVKSAKKHVEAGRIEKPYGIPVMENIADRISSWFEAEADDLAPPAAIELLRRLTYEAGLPFDLEDADKLKWLLSLIDRLVGPKSPRIQRSDWPVPIQFRIRGLFRGSALLADYVLLYEALIHFHFVAVASQFLWLSQEIENRQPTGLLPATAAIGEKILFATLNDAKCIGGGRSWLHRAAGLSRAGHDLLLSVTDDDLQVPFPEFFGILEPEQLVLHTSFGTGPNDSQIIREGGAAFGVFTLMQQVRNVLFGHHERDLTCQIPEAIAEGLSVVLRVMCDLMRPYLRLNLALTGYDNEARLGIELQWFAPDGEAMQPDNHESRREFFAVWGKPPEPEAPIPAPTPPTVDGWSWEDSLLLVDPEAARERYLYLMPMGCRDLHKTLQGRIVPGLLHSVAWRRLPGTGRTTITIVQRRYLDTHELTDTWQDGQRDRPLDSSPAHENVRTLVERIQQKYELPMALELVAAETERISRTFDLNHGEKALAIARTTIPRPAEVTRIFEHAHSLARNAVGATRLVLIGPSGIGKSVLMAQMYAQVREHALFFTMDSAPEPEFEVTSPVGSGEADDLADLGEKPPSIDVAALSLGSARQERSIGIPVRMHWLASARRLMGKPTPQATLQAAEVQRQLSALLHQSRDAHPDVPFFIFIDAVNQAVSPDNLLQGLRPFSSLPRNVIIIASSQDIEQVLIRLSENGAEPWNRWEAEAMALELTSSMLLGAWGDTPRPTLSPDFLRTIHARSGGMPLLLQHWGTLLKDLYQSHPASAQQDLLGFLDSPSKSALPATYFDKMTRACADFVPRRLPEAVMWCLSMVARPLSERKLLSAVSALRPFIPDLPAISRASIEAALARLGGYVIGETSGLERVWRPAHPMIGEAWIDHFGNEEISPGINQALLGFGAQPAVSTWPIRDLVSWREEVFEFSPRYTTLEVGQKREIVDFLLLCLERLPEFTSNRHRLLELLGEKAWLLHKDKRTEEARAFAAEAISWTDRFVRENSLDPAELAELEWGRAGMLSVLAIIEWAQGSRDAQIARFESVLSLRLEVQPKLARWSDRHQAQLASAFRNTAVVLGSCGSFDLALGPASQAIELREQITSDQPNYRTSLAEAYCTRAWNLASLGRHEDACADYGRAIELYGSIELSDTDNTHNLVLAHNNRAVSYANLHREEPAIDDYGRAIALCERLDLANPEYRDTLAMALHWRAISYKNLSQFQLAAEDFARAAEIYDTGEMSAGTLNNLINCKLELARCLRSARRVEQAVAACDDALAVLQRFESSPVAERHRPSARKLLLELLRESGQYDLLRDLLLMETDESVFFEHREIGALLSQPVDASEQQILPFCDEPGGLPLTASIAPDQRDWVLDECGIHPSTYAAIRDRIEIRNAPLSFYPGAHLLALIDPGRPGRNEIFALARFGQEIRILDWSNGPIYAANTTWQIDLSDEGKARDYLKFFFRFVRGRHGRFLIVQRGADIAWSAEATAEEREACASRIQALTRLQTDDDGKIVFGGQIIFKDSLFGARMSIDLGVVDCSKRGLVVISDEEILQEDLHVREDAPPWLLPGNRASSAAPAKAARPTGNLDKMTEAQLYALHELGHVFDSPRPDDDVPSPLICEEPAGLLLHKRLPVQQRDWVLDQCGFHPWTFDRLRNRIEIRMATLPFYPDAHLLVLIDSARNGRREIFALAQLEKSLRVLDWSNGPIYEANTDWNLAISDEASAIAYIRLFFQHVRGKHGRFLLVERPADIRWSELGAAEQQEACAQIIHPIRPLDACNGGRIGFSVTILFQRDLFECLVEVDTGRDDPKQKGLVTLSNEQVLLEDLNVEEDGPPWLRP